MLGLEVMVGSQPSGAEGGKSRRGVQGYDGYGCGRTRAKRMSRVTCGMDSAGRHGNGGRRRSHDIENRKDTTRSTLDRARRRAYNNREDEYKTHSFQGVVACVLHIARTRVVDLDLLAVCGR